jgi:hypothetical protein
MNKASGRHKQDAIPVPFNLKSTPGIAALTLLRPCERMQSDLDDRSHPIFTLPQPPDSGLRLSCCRGA